MIHHGLRLIRQGLSRNSQERRAYIFNARPVFWSFGVWTVLLGIVLMLAPHSWFGPSWSYFPQLPHDGFGMGVACTVLGSLQLLALWLDTNAKVLSILLFLNAIVYWTAGIILGAEGILGKQGLMETPFMLYVGAHAGAHSAVLMTYYRRERRLQR